MGSRQRGMAPRRTGVSRLPGGGLPLPGQRLLPAGHVLVRRRWGWETGRGPGAKRRLKGGRLKLGALAYLGQLKENRFEEIADIGITALGIAEFLREQAFEQEDEQGIAVLPDGLSLPTRPHPRFIPAKRTADGFILERLRGEGF